MRILVVTPTLGVRDSLDKTIESVKPFKTSVDHVLVAPKENVEALREKYALRVIPESEGKPKGIYAALNTAFEALIGDYDYMTFINDDDYWLPNFSSLIDSIETSAWDMVYARTYFVDEKGDFLSEQTSCPWFTWFGSLLKRKGIVMLTQQATIIKTSLFRQLSGFDTSYKLVADTKFWIEASQIPDLQVKYIDKVVAAYRVQEGQLSSDVNLQRNETERLLDEFPGLHKASLCQYLAYRLYNWRIYLRRFFRGRMTNPMR